MANEEKDMIREADEVKEAAEAQAAEAAEAAAEAPAAAEEAATERAAEAVEAAAETVGEAVGAVAEAAAEAETPAQEDIPDKKPSRGKSAIQKARESRAAKAAAKKKATPKGKQELRTEMELRKSQMKHSTMEISGKLKQMLANEIDAYNHREKHRAAEILAVFAKHNFYANGFTPAELCSTLEDLGPTYVKIGQIMSSRVDLLPEEYCKALETLRANVKELDPAVARAVIEQETGKSIDELYSEFRDKPLGSASVGQAHYAVLKDGTPVVTKVQRPLIAEMMRKDFVLLKKLAKGLNVINEGDEDGEQMVDLLSVIKELEKVEEEELDFRVEAENTRFFKENCIEDETKVNCPSVVSELTTERIFTMTFVDGCSVSKKERLQAEGVDLDKVGYDLIANYVHQILDVGTFHADPHQGNIMVSHGVPYWIDFGMIGRITDADINLLQNLIIALLEMDLEALVNAVMSMGAASPKTNRTKLMEDLGIFLDKYMSITSATDLDMAVLLGEITELATKHHISLPGKYTMLVRSIATIEGVVEDICPTVNLFEILSGKLMERAKKSLDVKQSLISVGKDALEISKKTARLPVLASDALNSMVKGRMKVNLELTGYEELLDKGSATIKNIVLAIFACVLFFGSCILATTDIQPQTRHGLPLVAAIGIVFSIALAIYTIRKLTKKKK